jgi:spermidine/putrescine transport system permease protein
VKSSHSGKICLISLLPNLWLSIFYLLPLIAILVLSFKDADSFGSFADTWSCTAFKEAIKNYSLLLKTLMLAIPATIITVSLAIPIAWALANVNSKYRNFLLSLVLIPYWTSFLIRIHAWKILLHPEGTIATILKALNILPFDGMLLYNYYAILAVTCYAYLPFAILPIYSAAEKFDKTLLEAAKDLGASNSQGFFKIFIPNISAGIFSAILLVFIPTLGSYLIPDLIGGPSDRLLGNLIADRVFTERNLPGAGAISSCLLIFVLFIIAIASIIKKLKSNKLKEENI